MAATSDSMKAAKQALRKELRAKLATMDDDYILRASAAVANQLFELPEYQQCKGVACFVSMPKEFNTLPILERLFQDGKSVYLPRVESIKERKMVMLKADSMADLESFPKNKWGIPEPPKDGPSRIEALDEASDLDFVVVPGLAFDKANGRMGQGAGFYDTYLEMAMSRSKAKGTKMSLVGVTLDELMVDSVPRDEHDVPLDCVLWPSKPKPQ
eukprot:1014559-Rhodomonas_salina.2